MKKFILAIPAVTLLSLGAMAQTESGTDATSGTDANAMFGTNWSLSVGTTFFDAANPGTLRAKEDIQTAWQSLTQEDRDLVVADCRTFMEAHGSAESSGAAVEGGATADTSTGGASTDTTAQADATTGDTGATAPVAGYDMAQMKSICEAALGL